MSEYNFQKELEASINNADPKLDRSELLTMIFKSYIAKCIELRIRYDSRIEHDAMLKIKENLISEFRKAALAENQKSVEQYEQLFDTSMEEILNDAANAHQGVDIAQVEHRQLEINPELYAMQKGFKKNESGLYVQPQV